MKIRERVYASGELGWQLDLGLVKGKRLQRSFPSLKEAQTAMKEELANRKRFGELGQGVSATELAEQVACRDLAQGAGATLREAVDFYVSKHGGGRRERELGAAVEDYLWTLIEAARSKRGLETMRCTLHGLAVSFPMRAVSALTRADVEGWLKGNAWAPKTIKNRLTQVGTFLNWCLVEKLCAENVAVGIPKPRLVEGEIGTLDWIQCRALLHAARGGPLLGYVVLGMFCGLRRAELERMNWDAVKLAEGVVVVAGVQAKTRQRRVVEIAPNAVAWLAQISKKAGKITPWDFKERFLELRKTAGLSMWPNNALRHTFASMHYAFHQNENLLQAQMGHENATMLHRHYRALKTRAEAEEFWGLKVEG